MDGLQLVADSLTGDLCSKELKSFFKVCYKCFGCRIEERIATCILWGSESEYESLRATCVC